MLRRPIEPLESRILFTTYYVTTADDVVALDGRLSLREAIHAANTNASYGDAEAGSAAGDRIFFGSMVRNRPIRLTRGELAITDDLTIGGGPNGITIESDGTSRLFDINTRQHVRLRSLTLSGGHAYVGGGVQLRGRGMSTFQHVHFTNCTADLLGGAVYNVDQGLNYGGGTLDGNSAALAGGAIYNVGPEAWLHDLTITSSAAAIGGGVYTGGAAIVMDNVDLLTNAVGVGGGGLFAARGRVRLADSDVNYNTARGLAGYGAGIAIIGDAAVTIAGASIVNNSALEYGGGVFNNSTAAIVIQDSSVEFNTATSSGSAGGGVYHSGSELLITGASIDSNYATARGGGLFCRNATLDIRDSAITHNGVLADHQGGGGVAVLDGSLFVNGVSFAHNVSHAAYGFGGAISVSGNAVFDLRHSTLTQNAAGYGGGGAIHTTSTVTGTISDSTFESNQVTDGFGGGAILAWNASLQIDRSLFNSNWAAPDNNGQGGAIRVQGEESGTTLLVRDSRFSSNRSRSGGAIYGLGEMSLQLQSVWAVGNHAYDGGAMRLALAEVEVIDSHFSGNSAAYGGGLLVWVMNSGAAYITNTQLHLNYALVQGGGLWTGSEVNITSSSINFNSAPSGGGIYRGSQQVHLNGTDISSNSADDINP